MPATTPYGLRPACHSEHRSGALRASARADSLSFRPGRPHALTAFAFTRLRRSSGAGSAYPLGAPRLKRGTPLRAPLDGGTVSGEAVHLFQPGAPLRWGAGSAPTFDRRLGATISAGAEIQKRLPRARRRGLLVPGLDGQTPTSWAPAAIERGASMAALAMLASLAGATHFNAQRASKWAVDTQRNQREKFY